MADVDLDLSPGRIPAVRRRFRLRDPPLGALQLVAAGAPDLPPLDVLAEGGGEPISIGTKSRLRRPGRRRRQGALAPALLPFFSGLRYGGTGHGFLLGEQGWSQKGPRFAPGPLPRLGERRWR